MPEESKPKKRDKRWVPNARRTYPKVPERLPWYKENQPRYEQAKESPQVPKKRSLAKTIAIAIAIPIIIGLVLGLILGPDGGGGGGGGGEVRNCIKSVIRDYPSCSDDDGTVKDTYLNGRYVGRCSYVDNVGNCY
jgi:hypothetical protein